MRDLYIQYIAVDSIHTATALEAASLGQLGQAASLDSLQVATIDPAQQAALAEAAADPNSLAALGVGISGWVRWRWVFQSDVMLVEISFSVDNLTTKLATLASGSKSLDGFRSSHEQQRKSGAKLKPIGLMTVVNTVMRASFLGPIPT